MSFPWNTSTHSKRIYPDAGGYDTKNPAYEVPRDLLGDMVRLRKHTIATAGGTAVVGVEAAFPGIGQTFVAEEFRHIPVQPEAIDGQPQRAAQLAGVHAVAGELAGRDMPALAESQVTDFPPLENWLQPEEPRLFPSDLN